MFRFFAFCTIVMTFTLPKAAAQCNDTTFQNFICKMWKVKSVTIDGKSDSLTIYQKESSLTFMRNGRCENKSNGFIRIDTWRYNKEKKRIELKDTTTGHVAKLNILEMKKDTLIFNFKPQKKLVKMEIVAVNAGN
ncbi:MAG: hypothetical protein EOP00_36040 [Pedobacter sp.]|nr:MAG: hypothetical protein EOP00_36040 [Pedobacter sp.]